MYRLKRRMEKVKDAIQGRREKERKSNEEKRSPYICTGQRRNRTLRDTGKKRPWNLKRPVNKGENETKGRR